MIDSLVKHNVIATLILCLCLSGTALSQNSSSKKTDASRTIQPAQTADKPAGTHIRPGTRMIAVNPDLTFARISIYKRDGYCYITPSISNLTSQGCSDVDLEFSINDLIIQPYIGVRFDGNSEFTLTGLGFEHDREISCSIRIRITRGCREFNLGNNTRTVSLRNIGTIPRTIEF